MIDKISLPAILIGEGLLWAFLCCWVNGPTILGYIAMQVVTSGVFAVGIYLVIRKYNEHKTAVSIDGPRPSASTSEEQPEHREIATVA